ncbi:MAG: hypothetical protein J7L25_07945, partial [Deltaproteobacteria bacterium]|nr:hypothetical protein [Candidatus Tharpella aukensis]
FNVVYMGTDVANYKKVPLSIALQKHSLPHNSKPRLGLARGRNGQVWGLVDVGSAIAYTVANPYSANSFVEKVTYLSPYAPVLSVDSSDWLSSNQIANILSCHNSKIIEADENFKLKKTKQSYSHFPRNTHDEIKEMCQEKWGNNYEMVNYCIKNQRNSKKEVSGYSGTIRNNCERKWGSNYEMVLYCIKNQRAAKRSTDNEPEDEISRFCRKKWGSNYEMVNHCTKNQRAAKENIERNYSGYVRKQCEEKWGNNYEMIEYCIKNQ